MRSLQAFVVAALLLAPVLRAEKEKAVQWVPFDEGVKSASASGKYVFVAVYTDWCTYCHKLDATTLKAPPVVAELDRSFKSVHLNAEGEDPILWNGKKTTGRRLAALWGVDGYPTLVFLNPKGKVIGSFGSYVEADVMVKLLKYISSGARERKVSFDDYLGSKG